MDEASAALDASLPKETSDAMYSGDVVQWKHLGYSLMLRAAMRLSKIDPGTAQSYVAKAATGGLMQSNKDNCVIRLTSLYINDIGNILNGSESSNYYLAAPFVNFLKINKDPRLASIAVRYVGAKSGSEQKPEISSKDTTLQIGMPMGYDNASILSVVQSNGLASFYDYSQLDRNRLGKKDAPNFLVTYAQTQLLLAEAIVRGWAQSDAAVSYENAIRVQWLMVH